MQILNKLTLKSMGVTPDQSVFGEGKDAIPCASIFNIPLLPKQPIVPVVRIFGRAGSCKAKQSDLGESFEFRGNFEATRLLDGEVFRASKLFLPKILEGLMADAMMASDESIDFIVEIGLQWSKNAYHYEWTVKPLMDSQQADQLAHLREKATADIPQLPAPEKSIDKGVENKGKKK